MSLIIVRSGTVADIRVKTDQERDTPYIAAFVDLETQLAVLPHQSDVEVHDGDQLVQLSSPRA
jgi:hypothetical protein